MAKFLYFQDAHFAGRNSRNRLGNYFEDCMAKFDEIIQIAKDNNCQAILDGGDLTETKNPSYNVLDEICDRIEKAQIPIYSLYGNHFLHCGHIENSQNTGLTHLQRRSKYFKYLTQIIGTEYCIKEVEYDFGVENELKEKGLFFDKIYENRWKIGIIHALITPNTFFDNVPHLTPKQLSTNADLILIAHYHAPYYQKIGNTEFVNPGCIGRLNINEAKIELSVVLLDTEKRNYEIIKLKSAKPSHEIFDLTKYEEIKKNEKSIDEYLASLNNYQFQNASLYDQIKQIGKDHEYSENASNYLIEKLKGLENV